MEPGRQAPDQFFRVRPRARNAEGHFDRGGWLIHFGSTPAFCKKSDSRPSWTSTSLATAMGCGYWFGTSVAKGKLSAIRTPTLEWAAAGLTTFEKTVKLSSNRPCPARHGVVA